MKNYITIIGGGLAGSEAAYQIAKAGINVKLYEMKPKKFSEAHSNKNLAEIVCSNSFKSNLLTNACGLLKEELRKLDSLLIKIADKTKVPAGQALAVDREEFSKQVTKELESNPLIEIIHEEAGVNNTLNQIAQEGITIIATGPLTSDTLAKQIQELTGQDKLYFYDAAAPIVIKDSIDMSIAFWGDRYEQERGKDETIEELKSNILSLEYRVRMLQSQASAQGSIVMNAGEETDFFNGEIKDVIIEALKVAIVNTKEGSRSNHILSSLISNNPQTMEANSRQTHLKRALNGYRSMDKATSRQLKELGFELSEEGKHWKIVYNGDSRYSYILPKTGSDYRGSLNAISDISNIIF